jgi:hypothetical protein
VVLIKQFKPSEEVMSSSENCIAAITVEAYTKINLHGARHNSEVICGFLVGSIKTNDSEHETEVFVEDVLPITHSNPVGPIFEIAGAMCKSIFPSKQVVGLYFTSFDGDYRNDESTPYFVDKVCDKIKANSSSGHCLVLTIAVNKINPTPNVGDVESDDELSSVLCLNAYMTDGASRNSSSSRKGTSGRERTASFQSYKMQLKAVGHDAQVLNSTLDQLLLTGKQHGIEDVQSVISGITGQLTASNQYINVECGILAGPSNSKLKY